MQSDRTMWNGVEHPPALRLPGRMAIFATSIETCEAR
jgi:hypothetical protein